MDENLRINLNDKFWYAFYTKPRHEFKARSLILEKEIECYLPTITRLKQWSDRKKKVTEPLINGYIFAYVNEKERHQVVQVEGILNTVSFKGVPAKIPSWQIENLRLMIETGHQVALENKISIGTRVKVIDGPMIGVEGIVYQTENNESMIAITIDILRRSVVARINIADVKIIKTNEKIENQ
ncbi:MAG: UpxY family transcription antiterminator [Melioribacteraceae bacterium]|nr:UpxY family transcription antiterminator [Melioribacteraceae bacterium]MCF8263300.1 UpxY family transcription antiterminator [Melioribacteraceae bacterium]MCF8431178.1 UpxY family transcription antiterminator [Melioribacteraceae bacterium]